ncbi:MAG: beta-ketoacyl-[acyl-carrier-protein] synthase family protein [Planctomycetota bacterium]|nr:MAG: beta-ketoacyl-[acyl-carrier-protein] synthase family protein [Planctomycetota bacterium]
MSDRRVVVTGLGPVSPLGCGKETFWNAILEGKDGSCNVQRFDTSQYKVHRACEVQGYVAPKLPGDPGPAAALAVEAARLALEDANFAEIPQQSGVVMGTTGGEIPILEHIHRQQAEQGEDQVPRRQFPKYPCHTITAQVARYFGLKGPNLMVPTACAAGNYAFAMAKDWIQEGRCDVVLAGGADPLSIVSFTGFSRLFAISPDVPRPFDKNRKGILPGEGAGILVLEAYESAQKRGAHIYAEMVGYGLSCDAYHPTMPHPESMGVRLAMERALADAGLTPADVDYISAHGTGTQANDKLETAAIRAVMQDQAERVPVSSVKSMMGHTMGAASALEGIVCSMAIQSDMIPPTIHYETPDPDCDLDYVPNQARQHPVGVALNNAYAFGGNNSCVVFARHPR